MKRINSEQIDRLIIWLKNLLKSDNFIIIIGVVTILPFIIISAFTNPIADDFSYNVESRRIGFWDAQILWYTLINGRYLTTAILTIKPLVSGDFVIYKLTPVILMGLLFYAVCKVFLLLFVNQKKRDAYIFVLLFFSVYLIQLPTVSQGFYWLSAGVCYQLANILSIILFCFLIKLIDTKEKKYLFLSIVLTMLIVGLNETSMLIIDFLLGVIFLYKSVISKKINYQFLLLVLFAFLFSVIVAIAPGNEGRASSYPNKHQLIYALIKALGSTKSYIFKWLPLLIVFILIFCNYFRRVKNLKYSKFFNANPFLVFVVLCSVVFIGFFTSYWAVGHIPPLRTINTIYFYFLTGILYLTLVLFFKFKKRNKSFITFSPTVRYLLIFSIILYLVHYKNNVKMAYSELLNGKAYKYDLELKERYEFIKMNRTKDTCFVKPLENRPRTLFIGDIGRDSENWINMYYAKYWNSNPIILEKK